ncbi:MAG TPA: hypothetical protein VML55_11710 [Planctomycetaceae bacterium]|nr:hypothetical protein [Planctomycetaceae bacterium]
MRIAIVVLQFLIAFVLTASLMPMLMVMVPAVQEPATGGALALTMLVGIFAVTWLVWPRKRA